jgi:hypothetical protein
MTAFACATLLPSAELAYAQPSDAAAAEVQFQEGRKLMEARRYGEACPKFLASYNLAPAPGTLLNLGDCYERNGQLASAWYRFNEAIALAQRGNRADREKTAKERAERLEPRLVRIVVGVPGPDVTVQIDGVAIEASAIRNPMPIDPGKHTLQASAPGKKPHSLVIDIDERTKLTPVDVPALEDAAEAAEPGDTRATTAATEPGGRTPEPGSTQRTLGIVAASAGGLALAAGTFFGVRTSSKWSEAQSRCNSGTSGLECDATGVDLAAEAKQSGNVATIVFAVGGVLLAGGAVLYLTAPSAPPPPRATRSAASRGLRARVGIGAGSVVVGGSF